MEMPNTPLEPVDEDWSSALAIVAHPDDLEFGSASAIARWTGQGKRIVYLLATRGEAGIDGMVPEEAGPLREQEERDSARIVGVDTVEFLDFPDGVLEYGLPLRHDFAAAVRRHKPEVVITGNFQDSFGPGMLNQADHIAVGRAVLDAVRDAGNRWVFRDLLDQGLEPWGGVHTVLVSGSPKGQHAVNIDDYLAAGVRSLEAHAQYLGRTGRELATGRRDPGVGGADVRASAGLQVRDRVRGHLAAARRGELTGLNRARRRRRASSRFPAFIRQACSSSAATSSQSGSDASSSCTPTQPLGPRYGGTKYRLASAPTSAACSPLGALTHRASRPSP